MTKIYLIRHCQAEGNVAKVFQGSIDSDISALGAKQLNDLNTYFREISLDRVYSSPKIRALKTAAAVVGNRNIQIYKRENLSELHGGIVEGRSFKEISENYPDLWNKWNNSPQDFNPENGEKMRDAYERIWNELLAIADENKGKTVAAATHGGVLRLLFCRLFFHDIERLREVEIFENTSVSLIEFDNALTPTVKMYNNASHLSSENRTRFVMFDREEAT